MKINPIGVEAYRQAGNPPAGKNHKTEQPGPAAPNHRLKIPAREAELGSRLAVKLKSGTFLDNLSEAEKQALEIFFEKYDFDNKALYNKNGRSGNEQVGRNVDITL